MTFVPAIIRDSNLTPTQKTILYTYASRGETYFATTETALKDTGLSKATYFRVRGQLEKLGVINVINHGTRAATEISINVEALESATMPSESPTSHVEARINNSAPEPPDEFIEASEAVTEPRSMNQIHRLNEFVQDGVDELTAKQIGEQWADEAIEREKQEKLKRQEWAQRIHDGVPPEPVETPTNIFDASEVPEEVRQGNKAHIVKQLVKDGMHPAMAEAQASRQIVNMLEAARKQREAEKPQPEPKPKSQKLFSELPDLDDKRAAERKKGGDEWEAFFNEHPDLRPEEAVAK